VQRSLGLGSGIGVSGWPPRRDPIEVEGLGTEVDVHRLVHDLLRLVLRLVPAVEAAQRGLPLGGNGPPGLELVLGLELYGVGGLGLVPLDVVACPG